MSRLARIVLFAAATLCVVAPAASAVPVKKLDDNLAALWTTLLQNRALRTPSAAVAPRLSASTSAAQ